MGNTFKDAGEAAEFQSAACDAILNTAHELGPDVDPAALAEAARDGRWTAFAIEFTEACMYEDEQSMAGLSRLEAEWLGKLAALRAGKGGD